MFKNRMLLVLCLVSLLILGVIVRDVVINNKHVPAPSKNWQITAKLIRSIAINGEPVIVQVDVKNIGAKPGFYTDTDQDQQFTLLVKNAHDEVMPLTRYGASLVSSQDAQANRAIVHNLKSNQILTYRILVNSRYDMTAMGSYSIVVKRDFGTPSSMTGNEAVSNTVTVLNGGNTNL